MKRSLLSIALIAAASIASAAPWTYRGTLNDGGKPANGKYQLRLSLINDAGTQSITQPITLTDVLIENGKFAADVDFGVDLSQAPPMKLKTEVRQGDSDFVALGEPSRFDAKAALAGICWDTAGNTVAAGEFLGSTNNVPLVFKVNNLEALRIASNATGTAANISAGSSANTVDTNLTGQTVAGGGSTSTDCGLSSNQSCKNATGGSFATVSGGIVNTASGVRSTVSGGDLNVASGYATSVGGGSINTASGTRSVVSGGIFNCAGGDYSWAGGQNAKIRPGTEPNDGACVFDSADINGDEGTFLWADSSTSNNFQSNGPNQFAIRAAGGLRWSGAGVNSTNSPAYTHLVSAANTCDGGSGVAASRTYLNHPLLNGNPNPVVLFSAFFGSVSSGSAPPRNPLAIYYNDVAVGSCPAGRWVIYQTSVSSEAMNIGSRYNIWFVLP